MAKVSLAALMSFNQVYLRDRLIDSIKAGGSQKDDAAKKEDVLNIFSVASGHLYERFLRSVFFICFYC